MNAIEAMHGITERPAVLGVHLDGDASVVRIRVSDTGKGIPPEALPHIFKPFFTTKGEMSGVGGVGLGLSVVYGVVHAHGGDIAVQSRLGAGTTFTITLPRRRDVLAPPADQRAEKEPEVTP
jgi:signal transduction histidine kinase